MTRKFFTFFSYMLIATFITIGFTSCSKDDDPAPEPPKTEEQIQAELKEELRTTMKFNSNYKSLQYTSADNPDFKSIEDFKKSFTYKERDYTSTKYMAPAIVIDKQGWLWFPVSGNYYIYKKYILKKEGDVITVSALKEDNYLITKEGVIKPSGDMGYKTKITFNLKKGESLKISEFYMGSVILGVTADEWVQDKSVTKPVGQPSYPDPSTYIDF